MNVQNLSAFSYGNTGGNPAGVVICGSLPKPAEMQRVAAAVGYSETAFVAPDGKSWRVRYFAPELEVPFCGHVTIAVGAALTLRHGKGIYALTLNDTRITVEGWESDGFVSAALQSPPTSSQAVESELLAKALDLFSLSSEDLDPLIPPALAHAGANHLVLALGSRALLAQMHYGLVTGKELMLANRIVTISLVYAEANRFFHARNAFASGGVYEDPATGAAAAALGGYLREIEWNHGGYIDIAQGDDMGVPSRIKVEIPPKPGASIRVSGTVRLLS